MLSLDPLLRRVTKSARYTGGEWNSVVKDWEATEVRVALTYPDLYELGMSNLGLLILYDLLNKQPHVLAERFFAPWVDMEAAMRQEGIPLYALESKRSIKDFDIVGFSLGYELTYTNLINLLDLAQIPPRAAQRDGSHPLIIAGGTCVLNPEPVADFIDLFVVGEGEEVLLELVELVRAWKSEGKAVRGSLEGKQELLREAARIRGIYVPSFYEVRYREDGTLFSVEPTVSQASATIERRIVEKLPPPVTDPVVPYLQTIHDRGAVEIQRGCGRGCRFCQAGIIYRPLRERSPEEILDAVDGLVKNCGYEEVALLSLSTSDYSHIENLVRALSERYQGSNLTLSLPSLRLDTFSVALADSLRDREKSGLTFAPEAGTERLRQVINKNVSEEEILQTIEAATERGWRSFKLYFMIGLPTETCEDVEGIVSLVHKIRRLNKQLRIRVSASTFVPKPHTPLQWGGQISEEELYPKHEILKRGVRRRGVHLSWQDPQMSHIEGVLSRGDRRLGKALYQAWRNGCTLDAWSERFSFQKWTDAFRDSGLDPHFYAYRERSLDELLPWSHIDVGVSLDFLRRECSRMVKGGETADCRDGACSACGLQRWQISCQGKYRNIAD